MIKILNQIGKIFKPINRTEDEMNCQGLCPIFADSVLKVLRECRDEKLEVYLFQGYRSFEMETRLMHDHPNVTNATGGLSWHNYGLAVDLVFKSNGKWSWDSKFDWAKLGEIGKSFGLQWGGDWKSIKDLDHFEKNNGLNIHTALFTYEKEGIEAVWNKVYPK